MMQIVQPGDDLHCLLDRILVSLSRYGPKKAGEEPPYMPMRIVGDNSQVIAREKASYANSLNPMVLIKSCITTTNILSDHGITGHAGFSITILELTLKISEFAMNMVVGVVA